MWVLATYDINTETAKGRRRLKKVAKICEGFGQRVQKSVFECILNAAQYEQFKYRLIKNIDENEDSLRFYRLTQGRPDTVEVFGINEVRDFSEPLVV
ncbi:MAG: CRISPR-associated endonuclease Cas2 [Chloroflexota bacterium]|nr:CRISPR-associated endonuclease Cas2 [Chloroflexota bacterium]